MSMKILSLFRSDLKVVNAGLESFAEALAEQNIEVLQMDWRLPAGGDARLLTLLDRLQKFSEKGD